VARTGLIGFILAVGLIMTGSLIPSIIAHTLANMLGAAIRKPMAPQPAAL
jgi:membrane protease YdiL (CAAX protease family)